MIYDDDVPAIYTLKNFALTKVEGTDMTYAEYVAAHSSRVDQHHDQPRASTGPMPERCAAEPDWDNLDWATLTAEG